MARATAFNENNVNKFFDKLECVLGREKYRASSIWNLDETSVPTVTKPSKIIATKGKRTVGSITSAERGTNVTLLVAVSASGSSIPPMFVFPRKKYSEHFVRDGPPDCIGVGNGSGWMTENDFNTFMSHFIKFVRPSKDSPILLVLDNHSSHLSVPALELAKNNYITMLSFPPHCSHRLQPLDVSVFGPFKKYLSTTQDGWMRSHPGKVMSIYDIPSIVRTALPLALNPQNIIKGFEKSGIYPFNKNIFLPSDFAPASVTDRPHVNSEKINENNSVPAIDSTQNSAISAASTDLLENNMLSTSASAGVPVGEEDEPNISDLYFDPQPSTSAEGDNIKKAEFSPTLVRPFPKAMPRIQKFKARRRTTAILTDTPEKEALLHQKEKSKITPKARKTNEKKRNIKKKVLGSPDDKAPSKLKKTNARKTKSVKKKVFERNDEGSSSDDTDSFCLVCCEAFSKSVSGEEWVQCLQCKLWAHQKCIKHSNSLYYMCANCDSDDDD